MAALIDRFGLDTVQAAMRETLDYAERRTRRIEGLDDSVRQARDVLEAPDGDLELTLEATVEGDSMTLDFAGSPISTRQPQLPRSRSPCPRATSRCACSPTRTCRPARCPTGRCDVIPAEGSLPERAPARQRRPAAGNVETSSRVADLVLEAFGRALGQGTMNNVTLGNEDFTYYETIGGGQGACDDADGPNAVHVAMSNTLNTPVEALELEFPAAGGRVRPAQGLWRRRGAPRR